MDFPSELPSGLPPRYSRVGHRIVLGIGAEGEDNSTVGYSGLDSEHPALSLSKALKLVAEGGPFEGAEIQRFKCPFVLSEGGGRRERVGS